MIVKNGIASRVDKRTKIFQFELVFACCSKSIYVIQINQITTIFKAKQTQKSYSACTAYHV